MSKFNEYSTIAQVAVRSVENAFVDEKTLAAQWQPLRFHSKPDFALAIDEYSNFLGVLQNAEVIQLPAADCLTIDSIYTRDSILVSPKGLILCNMGRASRTPEAAENAMAYKKLGHNIAGSIASPGTLEGGDFIWIDETHAAVGLGPRTNHEGIRQLRNILGDSVEVFIVALPEPEHPDDVLHLMSIISPLDKDLALVYRPLMPKNFIDWLALQGIQLVDVPEEEYLPMGCNVLAIAPRSALMLENLPGVKARLEAAGCAVATYSGLEISRKGEGGPTCLTRPLVRV